MSKPVMKAVKSVVGQKLELHEIEKPSPGPGQVLIRVHAAGVNRPDLLQRAGAYPPPPGAPATLGLEVAGLSGWVIIEDGRLTHFAELQTHTLTVLQINRGKKNQIAPPDF